MYNQRSFAASAWRVKHGSVSVARALSMRLQTHLCDRAWFAAVTNDDMTDVTAEKHYITIIMVGCCAADQQPKLMEPDKCDGYAPSE